MMKSRTVPWLVAGLLFAFGMVRIALILPARAHENDFAHYYVTSHLWLEGKDPYTTPFAPEFARYGFHYDPRIPSGGNAPPLVAAFAPIALLPPGPAFIVWVASEFVCLLLTLAIIARLVRDRLPPRMVALLLGLLVASSTLFFHFYFSQVQLLLGALLLGAYALHRAGRYSTALALATIAALLKLFPAVLLPWFFLRMPGSLRTRLVRAVPACLLIALSGTCTFLWAGFLHAGSNVVGSAVVNQTFNFSLPSLIMNIGVAQEGFAIPSSELVLLWRLATAAALLLVALAYAPLLSGERHLESEFCVLLLLATVSSPTAWGHYFVLAFFPFSVFVARMLNHRSARHMLAIAVVFGLTINLGDGVSLPARIAIPLSERFSDAWRVAFTYSPLYASLALAGWFRAGWRVADGRPAVFSGSQ